MMHQMVDLVKQGDRFTRFFQRQALTVLFLSSQSRETRLIDWYREDGEIYTLALLQKPLKFHSGGRYGKTRTTEMQKPGTS